MFTDTKPLSIDRLTNTSTKVRIGNITVWFSYETPIAFQRDYLPAVARVNDWSTTTGKHLHATGVPKEDRIPGAEFEEALRVALLADLHF